MTHCSVPADPCCNVIGTPKCESSSCFHPKDWIKRGQACAYHEHWSPEEWKSKFHTSYTIDLDKLTDMKIACAGDDFQEIVDLTYLKGTTAFDHIPRERFARFENPNSMVWTHSTRP